VNKSQYHIIFIWYPALNAKGLQFYALTYSEYDYL